MVENMKYASEAFDQNTCQEVPGCYGEHHVKSACEKTTPAIASPGVVHSAASCHTGPLTGRGEGPPRISLY